MYRLLKYYRRKTLKKKWGKNIYNIDNLDAYKEQPLYSVSVKDINHKKGTEIPSFKIERTEVKNFYSSDILIEHDIDDVLYIDLNGEWKEVLSHSIYSYEKELDHGREKILKGDPLIPTIYIDLEYKNYYIEDETGYLYCSFNKWNWFMHNLPLIERLYFNRYDKMRKKRIPLVHS